MHVGESLKIMAFYEAEDEVRDLARKLKEADPEIDVDIFQSTYNLMGSLQENDYDCVISGTSVKGFDIIELAKRVRELYETPFIIYTDKKNEEVALKALHEGIPYQVQRDDDPDVYRKLVQRIKFMVRRNKSRRVENPSSLPQSPSVYVKDKNVYVLDDDGSETLWGCDINQAEDIARKMELELKATDFVRNELAKKVTELSEALLQSEVPSTDIPNIIYDGYCKLKAWFLNTYGFTRNSHFKYSNDD
jgi:DNA-binding response OmpR family regulator